MTFKIIRKIMKFISESCENQVSVIPILLKFISYSKEAISNHVLAADLALNIIPVIMRVLLG